ncbi:calcium/sodium antiporter [Flammeovirgaceae bacterium SG7u.111]|nr:calcium/sodium antiporter [Flammeovirgaceae bacterium SG7u.132]WPO38073.1 calcium/sodium antiporter [Flammeovirgaceae bacterium SG7u.111]
MNIYLHILLLGFGFGLLIKGASILIDGAIILSRKRGYSEFFIGLTVVSFGTSLPELIVNTIASYSAYDEMVYSNLIGSNIFNMFMVLGLVGLVYPIVIRKQTIWREVPFLAFATVLIFILSNDVLLRDEEKDVLSRLDAIILLIAFVLFLAIAYLNLGAVRKEMISDRYFLPGWKIFLYIAGGSVAAAIGGELIVSEASHIAKYYEISTRLFSITVIATITTLPELATSVVAVTRKRSGIALGNVIGSNTFNFLFVLPVSSLVHETSYKRALNFDLNFFLFGTILLFLSMFAGKRRKLDRWGAFIFLVFFCAYVYFVFIRM